MKGKRMQGRAGQAALHRRRAMHPICAHCRDRGITRAAVEMDHIHPLAFGGKDVDDNIQGLCLPCHAIKTAMEDTSGGGASNHPGWLRPASGQLTILHGPPCAGKSTLVAKEAGPVDLVIDLDAIARAIRPSFNRRWDGELLNQSIRARNAMLGSLSRMPPGARSWFVVGAPTRAERDWWSEKLKPLHVLELNVPIEECLRRCDGRPGAAYEADKVREYFGAAKRTWTRDRDRVKRQAFGADGFPLEEGK